MLQKLTVEETARLAHEVNRAACQAHHDLTHPPWDEAPEWQRESMIKGVKFRLTNPDAPLSAQHDAWLVDKIAAGWHYGKTKNADLKIHPAMVPYELLPTEQRLKDYLFRAVVLTVMGHKP